MRAQVVVEDDSFLATFLCLTRRQLRIWMQTSEALRHRILWAIGELLVPLCDICLDRRADILAGARRLKRRLDVLFLYE